MVVKNKCLCLDFVMLMARYSPCITISECKYTNNLYCLQLFLRFYLLLAHFFSVRDVKKVIFVDFSSIKNILSSIIAVRLLFRVGKSAGLDPQQHFGIPGCGCCHFLDLCIE